MQVNVDQKKSGFIQSALHSCFKTVLEKKHLGEEKLPFCNITSLKFVLRLS